MTWLLLMIVFAVMIAAVLWGEFEHWRSSRRWMGSRPGGSGNGEAVLVLGYRNRGTRANIINRWRVRAGLRSGQPGAGPSRLVLCGGAVGGSVAEADLMACYARGSCGYAGELITEVGSHSTRENVRNAVPSSSTRTGSRSFRTRCTRRGHASIFGSTGPISRSGSCRLRTTGSAS